jgi:hypothetical protein
MCAVNARELCGIYLDLADDFKAFEAVGDGQAVDFIGGDAVLRFLSCILHSTLCIV